MPPNAEPLNPLAALHVLAAHLEARARAGKERIWMSAEARAALKEICRMKPGRMVFTKPGPLTDSAAPATPAAIHPQRPAEVPAAVLPPTSAPATRSVTPRPQAAPGPSIPAIHHPLPDAAALTRRERLADVARRAEASPKARAIGSLRDKMVFATGNPNAEIMLVGEAPGAQEEKLGEPFVGPAGNLLDRILKAMGLDRDSVYISNICKFRPKMDDGPQGTKNRKPTLDEMQACLEYVHEEIAIIQPRAIIALGATAAEGLLQKPITVGRVRGQWMECQGIPLMITFHPSYLLRAESEGEMVATAEKRKLWEDMLKVMERLNMTVTDKQRGYFLPRQR